MTNKALERGTVLPMKVPSTVKSGDMLVFGTLGPNGVPRDLAFGIATEDAQDAFSNVKALIGVDTEGAFNLAVTGQWGCPLVTHALKAGDPVYADIDGAGGSYDSTTNCWTGFKLNGNGGGVYVGITLDPVTAGSGSTTVRVVIRH